MVRTTWWIALHLTATFECVIGFSIFARAFDHACCQRNDSGHIVPTSVQQKNKAWFESVPPRLEVQSMNLMFAHCTAFNQLFRLSSDFHWRVQELPETRTRAPKARSSSAALLHSSVLVR